MSVLTAFARNRSCGTFRGWLAAWWDAAPWRRRPEPFSRCYMGGPVDDSVWCRRQDQGGGEWFCKRHQPTPDTKGDHDG